MTPDADLPDIDQTAGGGEFELISRPRKLSRLAIIVAIVFVAVFVAVGVFLKKSEAGVNFTTADQVSIAGIGFILAGLSLLFTRPRVWANARYVKVRNVFTGATLPWEVVREISVPGGSAWAVLDLQDDDQVAILGLQSNDGPAAVEAIRRLRALHAAATS